MGLSVGLQLFTLRNEMEKDFIGTLETVKALGYEGVELAGLFGREGKEVRTILDDLNLKAISAHVPLGSMLENPEQVFNTYKEIGVEYVVIPYLPDEDRPEAGNFKTTLLNVEQMCRKAKEFGLKMLYHNHDFEFDIVDGEYYLDTIYKTIPADLLETEIDTCWVNVAGENPSEYVKKYAGRAPVVHLKDFVMAGKASKENLYELIGIDKSVEADQEEFAFRPLGYGVQDFESIIKACKEAGATWVIVEQDRPAKGQEPIESVELSMNYLKGLDL